MRVIGTAGHIDHGKSALVHRLTGMDPDRLEEEKRRGMTIDLGFAWLTLPSGTDVSVVDVPGHERFVKNMLAGAAGIDVALLVIAADEGPMPQTREHLAILDLLGVQHGVVALTKSDLVDSDWLDLVTEEVEELLTSTGLSGSPIIPVSVISGAGLDQLLLTLDETVARTPEPQNRGVPYLPIDRVFHVAGFGTVVTGTLHNGGVATDQTLESVPGGASLRVRSMQTHQRQVEFAEPGARVALNVHGAGREDLTRGDVLALPHTVAAATRLDARLRVLSDAPFSLVHGVEATVHLGAAERSATIRILGAREIASGGGGWVRLLMSAPVAAVRGQKFILRLPAPARTFAGGEVVDVQPPRRKFGPEDAQRLADLGSDSLEIAILAVLRGQRPKNMAAIVVSIGHDAPACEKALTELISEGKVVEVDGAFLGSVGWEMFTRRAERHLSDYHGLHPLRQGMPREELRQKLRWERVHWSAALRRMQENGLISLDDASVRLAVHQGGVQGREPDVQRVLEILERNPFSPPSGPEILAESDAEPALLAAMVTNGSIVRLSDDVYFTKTAYRGAIDIVASAIQDRGELTVAQVRDDLKTSRKYALALLEYLDAQRITRRNGDVRTLDTRYTTCA
jgi:selenocysteine-specific elongation factor